LELFGCRNRLQIEDARISFGGTLFTNKEHIMTHIFEVHERQDLYKQAVQFIWEQWGDQSNYNFYKDCIDHSSASNDLPKFYIAVQGEQSIIGCYALLRSDLNSRQDLYPWFACLFVAEECRGKKVGALLQNSAIEQIKKMGFDNLYLCTDLEGYYERFDWSFLDYGYLINGHKTRIYRRTIK